MDSLKKSFWPAAAIYPLLSAGQDDEEISQQTLLSGTWSLDEQYIEKVTVSSVDDDPEFTEEEFIQYLAINGEDIDADELQLFSKNTTFTFHEDSSYRVNDADNSETTITSDWTLNNDEAQFSLSVSNESLIFDIQSLSDTRTDVSFTMGEVTNGALSQINFVFSFSK